MLHLIILGLVQQNLDTFKYSTVADFVRDVRQIFMNAVLYNSPETEVCKAAQQVSEIFEKEFAVCFYLAIYAFVESCTSN